MCGALQADNVASTRHSSRYCRHHWLPQVYSPIIYYLSGYLSLSLSLYNYSEVRLTESNGPAVVHCSAGIGRTGVLIAVDIGMKALNAGEGKLDILRAVSTLRQDRAGCVQTRDQYKFVHQVHTHTYIHLPHPHSHTCTHTHTTHTHAHTHTPHPHSHTCTHTHTTHTHATHTHTHTQCLYDCARLSSLN